MAYFEVDPSSKLFPRKISKLVFYYCKTANLLDFSLKLIGFCRVEEERRRQEALEEERKRLEKERQLENGGTSGEITENGSERPTSFSGLADYNKGEAENEIQKLSQMVEQINPKLQENNEQVDLDQLFHFLSNEVPDSVKSGSIRSSSVTGSSETPEKSSILDEIDRYVLI